MTSDQERLSKSDHLSKSDRQELFGIAQNAMKGEGGFGSHDDQDIERAWASNVLRLLSEVSHLELSLSAEGGCEVCWTTSWEPVGNQTECIIDEHPHPEEACFRCGMCAILSDYKVLKAENHG